MHCPQTPGAEPTGTARQGVVSPGEQVWWAEMAPSSPPPGFPPGLASKGISVHPALRPASSEQDVTRPGLNPILISQGAQHGGGTTRTPLPSRPHLSSTEASWMG